MRAIIFFIILLPALAFSQGYTYEITGSTTFPVRNISTGIQQNPFLIRYDMGSMPDIKLLSVIRNPNDPQTQTVLQGCESFAYSSLPNACGPLSALPFIFEQLVSFGAAPPDSANLYLNLTESGFYEIKIQVTDTNATYPDVFVTIPLQVTDNIPTMSEWGIFLFALIMLNLGLVTLYNSEYKMAISKGGVVTAPQFQIPFELNSYKRALKHALGFSVIGFAIIYIGWGEITGMDVFGMAASVAIIAYVIHLDSHFKRAA